MNYTNNTTRLKFTQPTDLLVCDPCYIFDGSMPKLSRVWTKLCEEWFQKDALHTNRGTIIYEGVNMLYTSTAYGDGIYYAQCTYKMVNNHIPVDAGLICVVSQEDAYKINPDFDFAEYLRIRDFVGTIEATGKGFIGDLLVNTDYSEEE